MCVKYINAIKAVLMELAANGEQQVPGLVNRQAGEVVGEVSYLIEFG